MRKSKKQKQLFINDLFEQGSGRVADFFSRWLTYTKDLKHSKELSKVVFGIEELKTVSVVTFVKEGFREFRLLMK